MVNNLLSCNFLVRSSQFQPLCRQVEHHGSTCATLSYQNFICIFHNLVLKAIWKFRTSHFNLHVYTDISDTQGVIILLIKSTMLLQQKPWFYDKIQALNLKIELMDT